MSPFMNLPLALRGFLMIISFWSMMVLASSFVLHLKKRNRGFASLSALSLILGYSCLQIMTGIARNHAEGLNPTGFEKAMSELPSYIVFSLFFVFMGLTIWMSLLAIKILREGWSIAHFSKLKIRLHDSFGLSLVATKAYYDGQDIDRQTIGLLNEKSRENFTGQDMFSGQNYESIYRIGSLIGVSLEVNGRLPEDERLRPIVCTALSECMINTFRHAWGDRVYVDISSDKATLITIKNNGKVPPLALKEKGGLKYLRDLVESRGGRMKIESVPSFTLELSLPKEVE